MWNKALAYAALAAGVILGWTFPVAAQVTAGNYRNLLIGGDFSTNPWQLGTPRTGIAATALLGPDRWFGYGAAGSSITFTKTATGATLAGFSQSMKFQRAAANANLSKICVAQPIESANIIPFQGQSVTLSFFGLQDANFSAASGLEVMIVTGTGTDQGIASLAAGTWTGQASTLDQLQVMTAAFARYSYTVTLPSGTTEAAAQFCWIPVGTAGAADDVQLVGVQLEQGTTATAFERRSVAQELDLALRYMQVIPEPAAGRTIGSGQSFSAVAHAVVIPLQVTMRTTPNSSASGYGGTVGTWAITIPAGTQQAVTALPAANTVSGPNACTVGLTTAAGGVAGNATLLQGAGGAGIIICYAELF